MVKRINLFTSTRQIRPYLIQALEFKSHLFKLSTLDQLLIIICFIYDKKIWLSGKPRESCCQILQLPTVYCVDVLLGKTSVFSFVWVEYKDAL